MPEVRCVKGAGAGGGPTGGGAQGQGREDERYDIDTITALYM